MPEVYFFSSYNFIFFVSDLYSEWSVCVCALKLDGILCPREQVRSPPCIPGPKETSLHSTRAAEVTQLLGQDPFEPTSSARGQS